jgi:hypothetical protein
MVEIQMYWEQNIQQNVLHYLHIGNMLHPYVFVYAIFFVFFHAIFFVLFHAIFFHAIFFEIFFVFFHQQMMYAIEGLNMM